jgi:putative hemolysin
LSVHDLAELLDVAGPEKAHYDTVAGFTLHSLGHIPQPGEEVVYEGYRLVVQKMEGRRIRQVVIAPLSRGEESEHADRMQETV